MTIYRIGAATLRGDEPSFQDILANAHSAKLRPTCLCRDPGPEMYVAKVAGKFLVKRMPNTGGDHAPACESYEPPPELSGLGQVMGSAIVEDPEDGLTALKLGFSLTKIAGRAAPVAGDGQSDSVKSDGNKLSLRGTLHYLWEEAGFNRWSPRMHGKRGWYVIRKHLLQVAEAKTTKGAGLGELLYIPESFSPERRDDITRRRVALMSRIAAPVKGARRLMMVIGAVKEVGPARYGHKIILKHLPDCAFMLADDLHKRMRKRFELEMGLWDAIEDSNLVAIGTFSVGPTGLPSIEEIALMIVTENWIPFENTYDKLVIDAMTHAGRRFMKGLRYNLPDDRPLACVVASDTEPEPTAMYVQPPGASDDYVATLQELVAESKLSHWVWIAGSQDMPALPDPRPLRQDRAPE